MGEIHRRAANGHCIGIVYRTLNTLVEAGMVKRQVFPDGTAHYERAGRPPHPHLIDVVTGTIVEIDHAAWKSCCTSRRDDSAISSSTTACSCSPG